MCFSASASFIASGGLAIIGGASYSIAKKEDRILAAIPLMFAIQQGVEGVQWIYLNSGSSSSIAGYIYLFFAFIVWPIYVPTFVYILDRKKQKILRWFIALGTIIALYLIGLLMTQTLFIQELNSCVNYTFHFPFQKLVTILYMIVVSGPLLISTHKFFRWFGGTTAILGFISWYFYTVNLISVWCFFAAIVSSMFFVYIVQNKKA